MNEIDMHEVSGKFDWVPQAAGWGLLDARTGSVSANVVSYHSGAGVQSSTRANGWRVIAWSDRIRGARRRHGRVQRRRPVVAEEISDFA